MPALSPQDRSLAAQIAVNTMWARTDDRSARTAPARAALEQKFLDEVDPDRKLEPAERARRAEFARRAYYQRLSLLASKARRAKAAA